MGQGSWRLRLRRCAIAMATVFVCALVASPSSLPGGSPEAVRAADGSTPNIVVVMTDDQSLETMRAMPQVRSLLGAGGVEFRSAFVNYPLCCPSRATLLTGQYAHNHSVVTGNGFSDLDSSNTLAVWLQAAGYRTAHVGKYLNGY